MTREAGLLRIRIPVKRVPVVTLFLAAWLVGWGFGEGTAIRNLLDEQTPAMAKAFFAFWLSGWTVGGLGVLAALLYSLFGLEELLLDGQTLRDRHSVLGLGWTRTFYLPAISDIRPAPRSPVEGRPNARALPLGSIAFEHGAKSCRIAFGLSEADVERVLAELRGRLPVRGRDVFTPPA